MAPVRTLHSRILSLKYRVRLYVACVRSSMLFGQHAVGLTAAVCYKLETADARALRAIAKSPSFITHEATSKLRARLWC